MAPQPDDGDYLRRFAQGDRDAFAALYRRYRDRVYGFAYRMLWEQSLAEDVTQECFLTLLKEPHKFDPRRASLLTFLCSIARNRILLHLRERAPMKGEAGEEGSDIMSPASDDPLHALMGKEIDALFRQAVLSLPPLQREVFVLREYEDYAERQRGRVGTLDTLKGVRPVWGRLGRNLLPKCSKALPFQTIERGGRLKIMSAASRFQRSVIVARSIVFQMRARPIASRVLPTK